MNEDKRQQARTQGRFMEDNSMFQKKFSRKSYPPKSNSYGNDVKSKGGNTTERKGRFSDQNQYPRYDRNKERNSDQRSNPDEGSPKDISSSKGPEREMVTHNNFKVEYQANSNYSFAQLETPKKPEVIEKSGITVLSQTDIGESRIFYKPDFITTSAASELFKVLHKNVKWSAKNVIIQGVEKPQPRLVAWFGPLPYTYSGVTFEAKEFPDPILKIKENVEETLRQENIHIDLNSVLLNLYRNEKDSVAWHSDDESSMGICPTIASVSLGEVRRFEMRRIPDISERYTAEPEYLVYLKNGSLIVMDGVMQEDWQHRVPKEYHAKEMRINLTFRTVFPVDSVPKPLAQAGYSRNLKGNISPKKTSIVQETFELRPDLFPSLGDSLAAPQRPKPQRIPKSNNYVGKRVSDNANESFSAPEIKIQSSLHFKQQIQQADHLFIDRKCCDDDNKSTHHNYRDSLVPTEPKPQEEQKPTLKSSEFEDGTGWSSSGTHTQVQVHEDVETQLNISPPIEEVDQLPSAEEYWDNINQSSHYACHQNLKGLNPNAQAWDSTSAFLAGYHSENSTRSHQNGEDDVLPPHETQNKGELRSGDVRTTRENPKGLNPNAKAWNFNSRSVHSYSENSTRSHQTGEEICKDRSPQQNNHKVHNGFHQNGRELRNDEAKSSEQYFKGHRGQNYKYPSYTKHMETYKDSNVPPRHHSKTSNQNGQAIQSVNDKSPQHNYNRQSNNSASLSKQNNEEIDDHESEFETMQKDLFDVYDYVAKNRKKFSYRDQEELVVLMPIVEISADLPIDIVLILTDRLRLLSEQNSHRHYGNRSYSSTQLGPRFNKGKPAGRKFTRKEDE